MDFLADQFGWSGQSSWVDLTNMLEHLVGYSGSIGLYLEVVEHWEILGSWVVLGCREGGSRCQLGRIGTGTWWYWTSLRGFRRYWEKSGDIAWVNESILEKKGSRGGRGGVECVGPFFFGGCGGYSKELGGSRPSEYQIQIQQRRPIENLP